MLAADALMTLLIINALRVSVVLAVLLMLIVMTAMFTQQTPAWLTALASMKLSLTVATA
jgi:hypothetical protein